MSDWRQVLRAMGDAVAKPRAGDRIRAVMATVRPLIAERDAAVAHAEQAEAEIKRLHGARLVMAVFGVPEDAPQPFALLGDDNRPFALGVQWPGGAITVKSTPPERWGVVTAASLDAYFAELGASPVVWLSEDLGTLADMEERAMAAEQAVARVRKLCEAQGEDSYVMVYALRRALDGPAAPEGGSDG